MNEMIPSEVVDFGSFDCSILQSWVQFTDDHAVELAFIEDETIYCDLSIEYDGMTWNLVQMHFHSPSEHTLGGGYFSAEAHMVHLNEETQTYIVLGVLLQEASGSSFIPQSNNTFFQNIWTAGANDLNTGTKKVISNHDGTLNPYQHLLPARPSHYRYSGSFTTPPCSEIVEWFVFDEPITISSDDLKFLRAVANKPNAITTTGGNSNRPIQELNGRTVYYGK